MCMRVGACACATAPRPPSRMHWASDVVRLLRPEALIPALQTFLQHLFRAQSAGHIEIY